MGPTQGLTFNPTKTVCIQFTRATDKTRKEPRNKLRINGTDIPLSLETRYLGVQIDSKLTWNSHFDITVTKAKRYLCQLVGALDKYWGPKPRLSVCVREKKSRRFYRSCENLNIFGLNRPNIPQLVPYSRP